MIRRVPRPRQNDDSYILGKLLLLDLAYLLAGVDPKVYSPGTLVTLLFLFTRRESPRSSASQQAVPDRSSPVRGPKPISIGHWSSLSRSPQPVPPDGFLSMMEYRKWKNNHI